MESELPWLYLAVKERLLADGAFATASHGRVFTRAGSDVTVPFATIQFPTPLGAMGSGAYRPIVQVDGWCSAGNAEDPELVVWRIAMRAQRVFDTTRNVAFETIHWSARPIDAGPLPPDKSRGDSAPLYHAMARAELTIHNR